MSTENYTPYGYSDQVKKEQVAQMFDNISGKYDFLNHFFSLGIDKLWRRKTIKVLKEHGVANLLDVATGTGDLAIAAAKDGVPKVTGVDISNGMLEVGSKKVSKAGLSKQIKLQYGDSAHLPFSDEQFDGLTVAFGVRNYEHLQDGLCDMHRVLQKDGLLAVLEFSKPSAFPVKQLFWFYFKVLMPVVGKFISGDSRAYTYLPGSVERFPYGEAFLQELRTAGFNKCKQRRLSGGIATLYTALK